MFGFSPKYKIRVTTYADFRELNITMILTICLEELLALFC